MEFSKPSTVLLEILTGQICQIFYYQIKILLSILIYLQKFELEFFQKVLNQQLFELPALSFRNIMEIVSLRSKSGDVQTDISKYMLSWFFLSRFWSKLLTCRRASKIKFFDFFHEQQSFHESPKMAKLPIVFRDLSIPISSLTSSRIFRFEFLQHVLYRQFTRKSKVLWDLFAVCVFVWSIIFTVLCGKFLQYHFGYCFWATLVLHCHYN